MYSGYLYSILVCDITAKGQVGKDTFWTVVVGASGFLECLKISTKVTEFCFILKFISLYDTFLWCGTPVSKELTLTIVTNAFLPLQFPALFIFNLVAFHSGSVLLTFLPRSDLGKSSNQFLSIFFLFYIPHQYIRIFFYSYRHLFFFFYNVFNDSFLNFYSGILSFARRMKSSLFVHSFFFLSKFSVSFIIFLKDCPSRLPVTFLFNLFSLFYSFCFCFHLSHFFATLKIFSFLLFSREKNDTLHLYLTVNNLNDGCPCLYLLDHISYSDSFIFFNFSISISLALQNRSHSSHKCTKSFEGVHISVDSGNELIDSLVAVMASGSREVGLWDFSIRLISIGDLLWALHHGD